MRIEPNFSCIFWQESKRVHFLNCCAIPLNTSFIRSSAAVQRGGSAASHRPLGLVANLQRQKFNLSREVHYFLSPPPNHHHHHHLHHLHLHLTNTIISVTVTSSAKLKKHMHLQHFIQEYDTK